MKSRAIETAVACAFLAFSGYTLAQSTAADAPADSPARASQPAQPAPAIEDA